MSSHTMTAKSVLFQVAQTIPSTLEVSISSETNRAEAINAVATALPQDESPCVLLRRLPDGSRFRRLHEQAIQDMRRPLVIRTPQVVNLPAPRRPSTLPAAREARKKMFLEARELMDRDPYAINLEVRILERSLMSLPTSKFVFTGVDAVTGEPTSEVSNTPCLWDTGAHVTTISDDIFSEEFRSFMQAPAYKDYGVSLANSNSWVVSVGGILQFSNTHLELEFIARVVAREQMPNGFSGVVLGQLGVIDCIDYRATPGKFLKNLGQEVPEGVWGDLVILNYYDAASDEVRIAE